MQQFQRSPRQSLLILAAIALAGLAGPAAARKGAQLEEPQKRDPEEVQNQDAMKAYQFGNQFFQQGMLKQAEDSVRKALQVQPTYPEAHYLLGLVLTQENDLRGAIAEAEQALSQNPFLTEAHNLMGLAYAKMGDYDHALKEFDIVKADVSYPTPEVAEFNIGKVFWEKQSCGEAIVHFRKAVDVDDRMWRGWYLLGDCQEQLGQLALAKQSYEKALALAGDEVAPMYRLGYVCFQTKDFACARQWLTKVRTLAPSSDMSTGAREFLRQMDFR